MGISAAGALRRLPLGKTLYVDDLVALESRRGKGFADALDDGTGSLQRLQAVRSRQWNAPDGGAPVLSPAGAFDLELSFLKDRRAAAIDSQNSNRRDRALPARPA
jgi:hypothetical protein